MKPCSLRHAEEDGRVVCKKIVQGDNEVGPNICRACPVMAINCTHLRFTLQKITSTAILVRYGNGRSEVWAADPPRVALARGACAAKVMPIDGPKACAGCTLHHALIQPTSDQAGLPLVNPVPVGASAGAGRLLTFPARRAAAG
jgi:hypothetical protein